MDSLDRHILDALQADGRLTNKALANRIGLSAAACLARVRRLERNGVIVGYRAIVNATALGAPFEVWGEIALAEHSPDMLERFVDLLRGTPEIVSAYRIAGRHDFLLQLLASSMEVWRAFVARAADEGIRVAAVNASVVVERLKTSGSVRFAE